MQITIKNTTNVVIKYFFKGIIFILLLNTHNALALSNENQLAYDFNLPNIFHNNKTYSPIDFKGKVILLNFWASWCSSCKKEMTELVKIQKIYEKKEFHIITVNIDNNKSRALKFLKKLEKNIAHKINYFVLYDKDKTLINRYNPIGLPASYLINKDGYIKSNYYGSLSKYILKKLQTDIDEALNDKK